MTDNIRYYIPGTIYGNGDNVFINNESFPFGAIFQSQVGHNNTQPTVLTPATWKQTMSFPAYIDNPTFKGIHALGMKIIRGDTVTNAEQTKLYCSQITQDASDKVLQDTSSWTYMHDIVRS